MVSCSVVDCKNWVNRVNTSGIVYHRYPRDDKIAKIWLVLSKRRDQVNVTNARVCSDHFMNYDYFPNGELKPGAIPSVFKNPRPEPEVAVIDNNDCNIEGRKISLIRKSSSKLCKIPGCFSDENETGFCLFFFPWPIQKQQLWLKALCLPQWNTLAPTTLKRYRICCKHFDEKYILRACSPPKLTLNAIPFIVGTQPSSVRKPGPPTFSSDTDSDNIPSKKFKLNEEPLGKVLNIFGCYKLQSKDTYPAILRVYPIPNRLLSPSSTYPTVVFDKDTDLKIGEMSNYHEEYEEPLWTPGGVDKIEIIDENPQGFGHNIVEYADPLADGYHDADQGIVLENQQQQHQIEEPFVQTTHYINITELLKSQNGGSDDFLPLPQPPPRSHLQQSKKPIPIAPKRNWNLPTTTINTNSSTSTQRQTRSSTIVNRPISVSTTNPTPSKNEQPSCVFCYNIIEQNRQNMTRSYQMELINFINIFGLPVEAFWLIFKEYKASINVLYCRTCSSIFQESNPSTKLRLFKEISKKSRKLPLRGGFYDLVNQLRRIFIDIFRLEEEKRIKLIFPKNPSQFQAAIPNTNYNNNNASQNRQRPISFVQVQPGVVKPPRPQPPSNNKTEDNIVLKCTDCEFIFLGPKVMASAMLTKHKLTHSKNKRTVKEVELIPKPPTRSLPTTTTQDDNDNDQDDDFINPLNFVEVEQHDDEIEIPPKKKNVQLVQQQNRTRPCPKSKKPPVEAVLISSDDDDDEVKEITIDSDSNNKVTTGDGKNDKDHQEVLADSIYGQHVLQMLQHKESRTCVMCYNNMIKLPITYDLKKMLKFMDIPLNSFETILNSKLYVFANFCPNCSTLIQNFDRQEDRNKLIGFLKISCRNPRIKHDKSADVNQIRQLLYEYYTSNEKDVVYDLICKFHKKMGNSIKQGKSSRFCSICCRIDNLRNKLKQEAQELLIKLKTTMTENEKESSNEKSIEESIEDSSIIKENADVQIQDECKSSEKKDKSSLIKIKDSCTRSKIKKKLAAKNNCPVCSKSFVNLKALYIHGMSKHKKQNQSLKKPFIERLQYLKCGKCESEKYFKTLKILKKHQIKKHKRKSTTLNGNQESGMMSNEDITHDTDTDMHVQA